MELLGFWSYVHADDDVDQGRVAQMARDVVDNYEAIKAERINLFLDRDDLNWGDEWRNKIDSTLSNVAFFIPLLTPRYFKSVECRRELQFFLNKTESLGISELILPILYIDVPELHQDQPSDPLMLALKRFQWTPWAEYRFCDRSEGKYRAAINDLAAELVRRVDLVERTDIVPAVQSSESASASAELESGTLDRLVAMEEAMPRWVDTLSAIQQEIERIGEIMSNGTDDISAGEKQGKGFAARLTVARRIASELDAPVSGIETLGQQFATDLAEIDSGVRALIAQGEEQFEESEPEEREGFLSFIDSLRSLSASSRDGLGSLTLLIDSSQPLEKMSKDMRKPLRRLRNSLTAMLEARDITDSWVDLVEQLDLET